VLEALLEKSNTTTVVRFGEQQFYSSCPKHVETAANAVATARAVDSEVSSSDSNSDSGSGKFRLSDSDSNSDSGATLTFSCISYLKSLFLSDKFINLTCTF